MSRSTPPAMPVRFQGSRSDRRAIFRVGLIFVANLVTTTNALLHERWGWAVVGSAGSLLAAWALRGNAEQAVNNLVKHS